MKCDFAQTYGIYNIYALDAEYAGVLAVGLDKGSRTKMKLNGERITLSEMLLAMIADATALLVWQRTRDGQAGRNQPQKVFDLLVGGSDKDKPKEFNDASEFFKVWEEINGD